MFELCISWQWVPGNVLYQQILRKVSHPQYIHHSWCVSPLAKSSKAGHVFFVVELGFSDRILRSRLVVHRFPMKLLFLLMLPHFQTHSCHQLVLAILAEVQNVVHAPYNGIGHRPVLGQNFGLCDFLRRPHGTIRGLMPCPSYPLSLGMFRNKWWENE